MKGSISRLLKGGNTCYLRLIKWYNSFKRRNKLFLITRGTVLSVLVFSIINWLLEDKFQDSEILIKISAESIFSTNCLPVWIKQMILGCISILITYMIDKIFHECATKTHFQYSHRIVTKHIVEIYSQKSILKDYKDNNRDIDRIIKSPLEYAAETLAGNLAPCFYPDHRGFNEMYNEDVKLIIAVTAENPNLWLDPTICFYLINCCAVSLLKNANNSTTGNPRLLTIGHYKDSLTYKDEIQKNLDTLSKFTKRNWDWNSDLKEFDFLRFFLYKNSEERECLENTVFPSLKASHDLFRMKTYFNQRDDIDSRLYTSNQLEDFRGHINFLWDEISKQNHSESFKEIINKRKKDYIPEFLFLFKTNKDKQGNFIHSVAVHTFVDGIPCFVDYREGDASNNGYQIVQSLISYIAHGIQNAGIGQQYIPAGSYLNTENSYIDWK